MKYKEWIKPAGLQQIEQWASQRLTNEEITKLIGIKHRTFYYWIKKYPEINEALERGRRPKQKAEIPEKRTRKPRKPANRPKYTYMKRGSIERLKCESEYQKNEIIPLIDERIKKYQKVRKFFVTAEQPDKVALIDEIIREYELLKLI